MDLTNILKFLLRIIPLRTVAMLTAIEGFWLSLAGVDVGRYAGTAANALAGALDLPLDLAALTLTVADHRDAVAVGLVGTVVAGVAATSTYRPSINEARGAYLALASAALLVASDAAIEAIAATGVGFAIGAAVNAVQRNNVADGVRAVADIFALMLALGIFVPLTWLAALFISPDSGRDMSAARLSASEHERRVRGSLPRSLPTFRHSSLPPPRRLIARSRAWATAGARPPHGPIGQLPLRTPRLTSRVEMRTDRANPT